MQDRPAVSRGIKAILLPPLWIYPVAAVLMAVWGAVSGDMEAAFAAPIVALTFTVLDYPIVVVVLWLARPATSTRVFITIVLVSTACFTLLRPWILRP
jgi:hypothetical protein